MEEDWVERSSETLVLKTLFFIAVVPGTLVGFIPWLLLMSEVWRGVEVGIGIGWPLGLLLISLATAAYLWCVSLFVVRGRGTPALIDPPRRFVFSGLYRYSRNPMYLAAAMFLFGEALLFGSWTLLVYGLLIVAIFHSLIVVHEEPELVSTFGQSYVSYRRRVPRWLPRLPKSP